MIISTIRMALPNEKYNDALKIVRSIAVQSADNPGCLSCSFFSDTEERDVLMVQSIWKSQEDLGRHVRSEDHKKLLSILEVFSKQPEVRFDRVSMTAGIEYIEKIRNTIHRA